MNRPAASIIYHIHTFSLLVWYFLDAASMCNSVIQIDLFKTTVMPDVMYSCSSKYLLIAQHLTNMNT